jgi:Fe-S oxidoreductase
LVTISSRNAFRTSGRTHTCTGLGAQLLDAKRLSEQSYLLSEFLLERAAHSEIPRLHRKALVHGHCHDKSVMGFESEEKVLKVTGLEFEVPTRGAAGSQGASGLKRALEQGSAGPGIGRAEEHTTTGVV